MLCHGKKLIVIITSFQNKILGKANTSYHQDKKWPKLAANNGITIRSIFKRNILCYKEPPFKKILAYDKSLELDDKNRLRETLILYSALNVAARATDGHLR